MVSPHRPPPPPAQMLAHGRESMGKSLNPSQTRFLFCKTWTCPLGLFRELKDIFSKIKTKSNSLLIQKLHSRGSETNK